MYAAQYSVGICSFFMISLDALSLTTTAIYKDCFFGEYLGTSVAISNDLGIAASYDSAYSYNYHLNDSNSQLKVIVEELSLDSVDKIDVSLKNNYVAILRRNALHGDGYLNLYDYIYNDTNYVWINSKVNNLSDFYIYRFSSGPAPQIAITDEYVVAISDLYTILKRDDNINNSSGWQIDTVLTCNQSKIDSDRYVWHNFSYSILCINETLADFGEYGSDTASGLPNAYAIAAKGDYIVSGHKAGYVVVLKRVRDGDNYNLTWSFADMFQINNIGDDFSESIASIDIIGSDDDDDDAKYIICGTRDGKIYVFEKMVYEDDGWVYVTNVTSPNKDLAIDEWNIAIEDDIMLIGMPEAANATGLVYVYKNTGSDSGINANWTQMAKITVKDVAESAGDSVQSQDIANVHMYFGWAVDLVNNTAIIGAPVGTVNLTGHVFIIYDVSDIGDETTITTTATTTKATMTTVEGADNNGCRFDCKMATFVHWSFSLSVLFAASFF